MSQYFNFFGEEVIYNIVAYGISLVIVLFGFIAISLLIGIIKRSRKGNT
jgi:hypothetical protein